MFNVYCPTGWTQAPTFLWRACSFGRARLVERQPQEAQQCAAFSWCLMMVDACQIWCCLNLRNALIHRGWCVVMTAVILPQLFQSLSHRMALLDGFLHGIWHLKVWYSLRCFHHDAYMLYVYGNISYYFIHLVELVVALQLPRLFKSFCRSWMSFRASSSST